MGWVVSGLLPCDRFCEKWLFLCITFSFVRSTQQALLLRFCGVGLFSLLMSIRAAKVRFVWHCAAVCYSPAALVLT